MISTSMCHRRLFCPRTRKDQTDNKSYAGRGRSPFWFVTSAFFVFWIILFFFNSSTLLSRKNEVRSPVLSQESKSLLITTENIAIGSENRAEHKDVVESLETVNEEPRSVEEKERQVFDPIPFRDNGKERSVTAKEIEQPVNKLLTQSKNQAMKIKQKPHVMKDNIAKPVNQLGIIKESTGVQSDSNPCSGRYIYVHNLPRQFNLDMLKHCSSLSTWTDMCRFLSNAGLGPPVVNSEKVYSTTGWFATNQFALDVIFYNRMKQYRCLTNDSSMASAIFVPFFAGLDIGRYLWGFNTSTRDSASLDLIKWLTSRPEWKVIGGRDHFMVAGRISWDFRRMTEDESHWGNKLLSLPESKNMSFLLIESSPWHRNEFAIPYPTYFHPSRDSEVFQWQNRMRRQKRRYLFSFAGAPRPNLEKSIRGLIIDQCKAARRKCKLLECDKRSASKCYNPTNVMKLFQSSVFCLQPPGDSYTRRSAFDSILAGCIPVFFHPGSAYVQYTWHLPKKHKKYSVFIPENEVREGRVSLEKWLLQIPREEVRAMRREVIRLIPKMIYADPRSRLETLEDAFDLAIQGVIKRVNRVKREIREGKDPNGGFAEKNSWKYNLFGTEGKHEWDPFFLKPREAKPQ